MRENLDQISFLFQETPKYQILITDRLINSMNIKLKSFEDEIYLVIFFGALKVIIQELSLNQNQIKCEIKLFDTQHNLK